QPDPIGLLGGLNLYQYAPNAIGWIDPLGLSGCDWKNRRTFRDGDSGLKDHARRHSNLTPEEYLKRGKRNITHGRRLKGGGKYPNANYYVRKIDEDNYSVTITDKNNKILSIDTWRGPDAPMTKNDLITGLKRSGVTPPKEFLGSL
ncbi:hypothetical protein YA0871_26340, partial [Pseudomonas paralactis]